MVYQKYTTGIFYFFQNIYSPKGAAELTGGIGLAAAEGAEGPATTHSNKNIIFSESIVLNIYRIISKTNSGYSMAYAFENYTCCSKFCRLEIFHSPGAMGSLVEALASFGRSSSPTSPSQKISNVQYLYSIKYSKLTKRTSDTVLI